MECLLTHLEVSEHPQKWQMFVDALENNGWCLRIKDGWTVVFLY